MEAVHAWLQNVIQTPLVADARPTSLPLAHAAERGKVRVVEPSEGTWPTCSSTLCWHCCHAFEGPPLPLPIKYDAERKLFHVAGTFCSWGCMKAYNLDSRSYMSHNNATIITLFHWRVTGTLQGIRPAPPRVALKAFGGTMTIEDFRACDKTLILLAPKMIVHLPVVEEVPSRMRVRPSHQELQDSVCFKDATAQNDALRLRRPKPLPAHNMLVRTLGVQVVQSGD